MDDQTARLPDDIFAEVLRRVPPRWLAASRCVCKAWRAAIDGRRLLRADLLPLSVGGLFFHFNEHLYPEFLSRPPSSAAAAPAPVSGRLDFLRRANPKFSGDPDKFGHWWDDEAVDRYDYKIHHHCNGLLLLSQWVVNPATGWWTPLPPSPAKEEEEENDGVWHHRFLVYDPTVSPHFEVLMIPCLKDVLNFVKENEENSGWNGRRLLARCMCSRRGRWEERSFVREGDAAETLGKQLAHLLGSNGAAVYLRGTLYVHCMSDFIMRISLTDNTYRVIKTPVDTTGEEGYIQLDMGRSEKGLYFAWIRDGWLRVWILKESCTVRPNGF
ncbi:uncharacterized protein LOC112268740 [Brachypodium distachyon]|uniref:F-box domain-containing protein n=1 Tax=Brachypodium distachyon TaxID=15368 RepID=A0A0Q3HCW4_BRADI|nr:uncharacterized protein LOC112268740 [Brachypodium distachyon]KQJ85955.2 hypothetical protein BRADI_4g02556v3 [Brachypodium distachyon]|eukprot:XP_024310559.1 uncharacterized protein LOC112268740 [Brachypodium distachyon]